jgi:hypothetical protein
MINGGVGLWGTRAYKSRPYTILEQGGSYDHTEFSSRADQYGNARAHKPWGITSTAPLSMDCPGYDIHAAPRSRDGHAP